MQKTIQHIEEKIEFYSSEASKYLYKKERLIEKIRQDQYLLNNYERELLIANDELTYFENLLSDVKQEK